MNKDHSGNDIRETPKAGAGLRLCHGAHMRDRRWPHFVAQDRALPHRHDRLKGHDWKRDIQGIRRAFVRRRRGRVHLRRWPSIVRATELTQMAEFGIGYDGRQYEYNGYRYGRLADAIAYTSLMRSRPTP